ncbi:von Willebrand factor type A domain-containing protein [Xylaria longipes]|nr:von Willebrand factor type A domain-containing protein [Xylaria longipes]
MLTIPPRLPTKGTGLMNRGEVLFMVDCSGTMGYKMEILISAMNFMLKGVPVGWKFNIWRFGSRRNKSLWRYSRDYSGPSLGDALAFIEETSNSSVQGTNFYSTLSAVLSLQDSSEVSQIEEISNSGMQDTDFCSALAAVLNSRDSSGTTEIILLTDGGIRYVERTIQYVQGVKSANRNLRIFILGLGQEGAWDHLEAMAQAGGGYAEVIPTVRHGSWEDRAVQMAQAAFSRHEDIVGVETNVDGMIDDSLRTDDLPSLTQIPRDFLDIVMRVQDEADQRISVPVMGANFTDDTIHMCAMTRLLRDLEREDRVMEMSNLQSRRHFQEQRHELKLLAEQVGCKWSLASKWTSFVFTGRSGSEDVLSGLFLPRAQPGLLRPRYQRRKLLLDSRGLPVAQIQGDQEMADTNNLEENSYSESEWAGFDDPIIQADATDSVAANADAGDLNRYASLGDMESFPGHRWNEYFIPREGIDREVIVADIKRYLGNDASVRPGVFGDIQGFYIRAYRNLTTAMIEDLKCDSAKWDQERRQPSQPYSPLTTGDDSIPSFMEPPYYSVGANLRQESLNRAATYREEVDQGLPSPKAIIIDAESSCADYQTIPRLIEPKEADKHREDVVHRLLSFQAYDGSFDFSEYRQMKSFPGEVITAAFDRLCESHRSMDVSNITSVVWTAVIISWLERDFRTCESLWRLMYMKGHMFLESEARPGSSANTELTLARDLLPATVVIPSTWSGPVYATGFSL